MHDGPTRIRILNFAAIILMILGLAEVLFGLWQLTFSNGFADDLHKRWSEQVCVLRGLDPSSLYKVQSMATPSQTERLERISDSREVRVVAGGYPPWSYLTGFLLAPPFDSFYQTRFYAAILNFLALAITLLWIFGVGNSLGRREGFFLSAAALAVFAHTVTLRLGQYGILVNTLLLTVFGVKGKGSQVVEGLALGLSAVKPQTAGLFLLIPLIRRRWLTLVIASLYVFAATAVVCAWVKLSPITMLSQMFQQATIWESGSNGVIGLLLKSGLSRSAVTLTGLLLGVCSSVFLLWRHRSQSVLVLAAIPAVVGRLWMYHRRYDDTMLIFLLVPLGLAALQRTDRITTCAFTLVGLSLWTPLRESDQSPVVILIKILVWIFGLAVLLGRSRPVAQIDAVSQSPRWNCDF